MLENQAALVDLAPLVATLKVRLAAYEEQMDCRSESPTREDMAVLAGICDSLGKLIERMQRLAAMPGGAHTAEEVQVFLQALLAILKEECDPELFRRIGDRIEARRQEMRAEAASGPTALPASTPREGVR